VVDRSVKVTLRADVAPFTAGLKGAQRQTESFYGSISKGEAKARAAWQMQAQAEKEMAADFQQRMAKRHEAMTKAGVALTAFGVATVGGLGLAAKAAIDWESAWAGVTKTVDGSATQMAALESGLRDLAKELPASHDQIAAVAEAAGQLGIKREAILGFTRTMVALGETTNLTADEAATAMARIANIMGTPQAEIDRLGAALVALGNDGASTEREIVEMALRIAGAGRTIGLTEADVLAFANALSSVGIEAEAGGTAISRVMVDIAQSVRQGGDKLELFARVAGMSATQFQAAFQRDAAGAIVSFVEGLGRIQASGGDTFGVLEQLELGEIRVRDALLRTSGAGDLLRKSLDLGARAWKDNTALVEEANKRYATTAARLAIARNQLNDFAIDIGETFLPAVGGAADRMGSWLQVLQGLPGPVKETGSVVGALAGAASLAGGAFFLAAPKVAAFKASIADLGPKGQMFARGLSGAAGILGGPWGIAIAGGITALGLFIDAKAKAAQEVREYTRALQADSGALGVNTRALVAHKLEQEGSLEVAQRLGVDLATLTEAVLGNRSAYEQVRGQLEAYARAAADAQYIDSGRINDAQTLMDMINGQSGAVRGAAESYKREAAAAGQSADAVDGSAASAGNAAAETGKLGAAADATTSELKDEKSAADRLKESIDALTGAHRAAYGAEINFEEALDGVTASVKENGRSLDIRTEKGRANARAILGAAEAASEHAQKVADETGSLEKGRIKLAQHREQLIRQMVQLGYTREAAQKHIDTLLRVPKRVNTDVTADTRPAARAIAGFEANVNAMLRRVRGPHKVTVSVSGNFVQRAGGRIFEAEGGLVDYYADGGTRERHVAQIAPAGAMRVWAEPETGGEAYIPLAQSKRGRSEQILAETAGRFGMRVVPMADGAILMRLLGQQSGVSGQDRALRELALRAQKDSTAALAGGYRGGRGVEQWRGAGLQALAAAGAPSSWIGSLLRRMNQESGGNPRAVNLWDINAQRGYPSVGLMQVIRPTFQAYAGRYRNRGPFMYGTSIDPLANIYSSIKYANARYGSAPRGWNRAGGYDSGGLARGAGYIPKLTPAPERVLSPVQTAAFERLVDVMVKGGGQPIQFVNEGVIGSQMELQNWLAKSLDNLRHRGR
jgi:TP901 family phage tail tape measure protein